MGNLIDFDPDRVAVLDWYEVVHALYPDVDLKDRAACEEKLNFILRFIEFKPRFLGQGRTFYWISPTIREDAKDDPEFLSVKKQFLKFCERYLSLDWLLPSGIVLTDMMNISLVSYFHYKNDMYVSFSDGCVVLFKPELHDEFLPSYVKENDETAIDSFIDSLEYLEV